MTRPFVAVLLFFLLAAPFSPLLAQEDAAPAEAPQTQPEPAKAPVTQASPETTWELVKCDPRRVYIGEIAHFTAPACIEAKTVFIEIPWYQLAKRTTEKGSARYWIYMTKANKVFKNALRLYTISVSQDLICEKNTLIIAIYLKPSEGGTPEEPTEKILLGYYAIPDVTPAVIPFLNPSEGIE